MERTVGAEMEITVNGKVREVPVDCTVLGLLELLELHPGMVVVERNREILSRELYGETCLEKGDTLELVHFVGGG